MICTLSWSRKLQPRRSRYSFMQRSVLIALVSLPSTRRVFHSICSTIAICIHSAVLTPCCGQHSVCKRNVSLPSTRRAFHSICSTVAICMPCSSFKPCPGQQSICGCDMTIKLAALKSLLRLPRMLHSICPYPRLRHNRVGRGRTVKPVALWRSALLGVSTLASHWWQALFRQAS